jgi:hypothetical protein
VRGRRVSKKTRKLDIVVEAVRYEEETSRVCLTRGYERVGYIWSDIKLFDRKQLVELLETKKRVVCGHPAGIQGDFEVYGRLQFQGDGEHGVLTCDGPSGLEKEDLGLPLF